MLEIKVTGDGSHTLYRPDLKEHYHSSFGALRESQCIFIEAGLQEILRADDSCGRDPGHPVRILEIGFGTGLNALLTLHEAETSGRHIHYTAIEALPVAEDVWRHLNYQDLPALTGYGHLFDRLHSAAWNTETVITSRFTLLKRHTSLEEYTPDADSTDLVYFDAFGPDVQPELWEETIFRKVGRGLHRRGILVTFSVKGTVVRALKQAGFSIEKLPGPPGKRHILRARKG